MPVSHFALFPNALGHCVLAWSDSGIMGARLPERDAQATRGRMQQRFPTVVELQLPEAVQCVIHHIAGLICGERDDLAYIALDMMGVPPFHQCVRTRAHDCAGPDAELPGSCCKTWRAGRIAGHRAGARLQPVRAHRALPLCAGRSQRFGRLFSGWRCFEEAEDAGNRRHAIRLSAGAVRPMSCAQRPQATAIRP